MKFCLRIALLLLLVAGTLTQDGFNLEDALGDLVPTPSKPKEQPKAPEKPGTNDGFGLDLGDALGPDPTPKPDKPAVKPPKSGGDDFGLDLGDALGPDTEPKTDKPAIIPPKNGGGGGSFDDSDLFDVGDSNYKPDGGRSGGRATDTDSNYHGGGDQPQEAGPGPIAGIVSAVGVALLGAASSYFAYQKKKLCFKIQGGADPESQRGTHSDPQVFSNLLKTS